MRYHISGQNIVAVSGGTGSATGIVQYLLGRGVTAGRAFWLRGVWAIPYGTEERITIFDGTAGDAMTNVLPRSLTLVAPTDPDVLNSGVHTFPDPGLKFSTGVCIRLGGSSGTGVCAGAIAAMGGWGYEE